MIYNTLQLLVILGHVCTASGPALVSWCVRAAPPPQVQFLWWPIGVGLIARGLTTIRPVARGRAYSPWLDKHKLTTLFPVLFNWGKARGISVIYHLARPIRVQLKDSAFKPVSYVRDSLVSHNGQKYVSIFWAFSSVISTHLP